MTMKETCQKWVPAYGLVLLVACILHPGLIEFSTPAQAVAQDAVDKKVRARAFEVVDEQGKVRISMMVLDGRPFIGLFNKTGRPGVLISMDEDQSVIGLGQKGIHSRILMRTIRDGETELRINDPKGNKAAGFVYSAGEGAGCLLRGDDSSMFLMADGNGSSVSMSDGKGKGRIRIAASGDPLKESTGYFLTDDKKQYRSALAYNTEGEVGLSVWGEPGKKARIILGATKKGDVGLGVVDGQGRKRGSFSITGGIPRIRLYDEGQESMWEAP